jgi:anti-sigma28 factor (negative regulator of flagellin synthesis)
MSEISAIGNAVVGNVRATAPTTPASATVPVEVTATSTDGVTVATDQVEFSEQAQLLEKIQQMPAVRQDQIDAIKDAIATNSYLTDEKLSLAIDRMIDEVSP